MTGSIAGTGTRAVPPARRAALALAAVSVAALAAVYSGPARAFDLFGLFSRDREEEPLSPDALAYTVSFEVTGEDTALRRALEGASQLQARSDEPAASPAALLARARGDYARLLAALYAAGHYGGTIDIAVDGRPPETIPADAVLPDPVAVEVRIDPGPVFLFREVWIGNSAPLVVGMNDDIEGPAERGLSPGEVARSGAVLAAETALVEQWRALSHAKAEISRRDVRAQHRDNAIDVDIDVDPGPPAVYGPVSVTGTDRMNPAFVERQAGLVRGERFDPGDLVEASRQLRRLEAFQSVRIVEGDEIGPDGQLPMTIAVTERLPRVFGFGGALSTVDGGSVEGYWQHRNLFGQAERLRVEGRVSGIGQGDWDSVDGYNYFLGTTFVKPGVFTPSTDFTAHAAARLDNLESYRDRTALARVGLAHRFDSRLTGEIAANVERSRIEDPLGKRDFLLASLPGRLTYDTRDSELDPREGWRVRLMIEPFNEFEFSNSGLISQVEASTYLALDGDARFVLAGRIGVGSITGAPRDEMPASRLFFAGGGGSIRGYAYRNVGPRLPNGEVVGGRSYIDGSAELRARITDNIGVVPFVDFGNAFVATWPDFSERMYVGAGIGLRYYTAIGPIRLDIAIPLDRELGDPSVGIYVGIGQAF